MQPKANRAMKSTRFFFILGGAIFTSIILFFLVGFLLMTILGAPIPAGIIGDSFLLFSFGFGPIIGGFIGYLVFKRSKYSNPQLYIDYYK